MKRLVIGVVVASVFSAASLAAQGNANNKQTAVIFLNAPSAPTAMSTWEPSLGAYVTFTTIFPGKLDPNYVYIQVLCYQEGALVFATAGRYDRAFLLGGSGSPWLSTGGAASCHADLYYWARKYNPLASTDFSAQGW
jgi:hypothetical protein